MQIEPFSIGRDPAKDFGDMCDNLESKGWEKVENFDEVKIEWMGWVDVNESDGALFKKAQGAEDFLSARINPPTQFLKYICPWIFVPSREVRERLGVYQSGIALPVFQYGYEGERFK